MSGGRKMTRTLMFPTFLDMQEEILELTFGFTN